MPPPGWEEDGEERERRSGIAGNRDGDSKDRSRKTTELVIKREQKKIITTAEQLIWSKSTGVEPLKVGHQR